jgi:hypothetical protein
LFALIFTCRKAFEKDEYRPHGQAGAGEIVAKCQMIPVPYCTGSLGRERWLPTKGTADIKNTCEDVWLTDFMKCRSLPDASSLRNVSSMTLTIIVT